MPIDTVGIPFSTLHKVTSEHVALSATCAMLRFRRSLAANDSHFLQQLPGKFVCHCTLRHTYILNYNVQIYEKYFIIIWVSVNN